jgi:putative ABC transport system ATP-binding protein
MEMLNKELQTTFLFSTHDEKVMKYLDRTIHLRDGALEKDIIETKTTNL